MNSFLRMIFLLILVPSISFSQFSTQEINKYKAQAKNVTIIRDKWGIPHIYGKTDADAVFGLLYAQCEENFPRVEKNYLEMMGRLSEVEGKSLLYQDLEMRLIYDSNEAISDYKKSPAWFRKLLDAFADGINYYLVKNPSVKPLLLKKFYPWFPLLYTDGSIGPTQTGGLNTADIGALYKFTNANITAFALPLKPAYDADPMGSNGFAIAPSRTESKKCNALYQSTCYFLFPARSAYGE